MTILCGVRVIVRNATTDNIIRGVQHHPKQQAMRSLEFSLKDLARYIQLCPLDIRHGSRYWWHLLVPVCPSGDVLTKAWESELE